MKKIILLSFAIALCCTATQAQRFLGVATGSWNAMNSLYLNPANIAGCNERLTINLVGMNVGVDNSLGTISSIGDISGTVGNSDSGVKSIFKYSNNNKFSMMVPSVEVRGPGVLYSINSRNTIAITTRIRAFNEFNNFDKSLYTAITNTSTAQGGVSFNTQNFNWTAHLWSEIGLSYGLVAIDNETFQVKAGATVRYLGGIGYLGLKGKNLDLTYTAGSDSLHTSNSDLEFASNIASSQDAFTNGTGNVLSNIFSGHSGHGIGADLGVTIVYKPDNPDGTNGRTGAYKAALSAAITDIGSINYGSSYTVNVTGNGSITANGISQHIKDYQDFNTYIKAQGYSGDTGVKATKVYLPTALVISADYNAYKNFFVNAMVIANVANGANFGSVYYSQFTVTPRFDSKIFSFGLPITYNMLTNNMRMGVGLRCSGFYIGSDDMLALFSNNQYGFNFYVGAMIPIYKKHRNNGGTGGIKPWKS